MATPVKRRSSRLAQRRCSLQSLAVENEEAVKQHYSGRPQSSGTAQRNKQKLHQPLRRSKRIIEQNTKSQSLLLPPSPISAIDAPFSTSTATDDHSESDVLPDIRASSIITPIKKTPSKSQGVRFGINSVAEFSGCDPPMRMERLSSDVSQHLFPHRSNSNDEDDGSDDDDDVTKQNCHILAQWDDSFDELDQIDDEDEEEDSITDHYHDEDGNEEETQWRNATLVLEEEEELVDVLAADITQNDNHRYKEERSRPTKRVDEYFCKTCGKGMRYTSRFVYEDD